MKKVLLLEEFEVEAKDFNLGNLEKILEAFLPKKKVTINLLLEITEEKDNAENVRD